MTNVNEICVDLGSYGDMLGNLSPTFGLKANSGMSDDTPRERKAEPQPKESILPESKRHLLEELTRLGDVLSGLSPREVRIWGA